jgi:hypothetical protein
VVDGWDAEWTFWKQVLAGDSTDNIRGCYKVGVGKAEKLLTHWLKFFGREPMMEMEEWRLFVWSNILNEYHHNIAQYPEKFPTGMLAHAAALENARLVFMLEHEGQLWNPPGVPHAELSSLAAA